MLTPRVTERTRAGKRPRGQRELVTASLVAVAPKDRTKDEGHRRPSSPVRW